MRLKDKRVAMLLDEGVEDLEFWVPLMRLREEGARVTVVGTAADRTVHGKNGMPAKTDAAADTRFLVLSLQLCHIQIIQPNR